MEFARRIQKQEGLIDEPWEYGFSSAREYRNNQKGLLEIKLI
jgi:hypothetical protein